MTSMRELAWQNMDRLYRSAVSYRLARYALNLRFSELPNRVVHQGKRCLLDALGCAIGAYDAPGRAICEETAKALGGPEEATLIGSGFRTSALNATLVNCFLVRFLDYNDIGGGGHNSDSIPAILAISEREKTNGRDFITSLVASYELGARVRSLAGGKSAWERKGLSTDARGGLNVPPVLGKLMGLNEEQIANAIGICASHSLPLGILDAHQEECSMTKNLRFGFVAYMAVLACLMAQKGFTGPVRVAEGESGLFNLLLEGELDQQPLIDFSNWRIMDTRFKPLCLNGTSQGHVSATLAIVRENDLKPGDIETVKIKTTLHESRHTTALPKKYPRNAESADHSAFFLNAIAIADRVITPDSYSPERFTDPVLLDLIEKITVDYDPELPEWGLNGVSEITTKDGRCFDKRIDMPKGFGENPLSDRELEDKFWGMAEKYMSPGRIRKIMDVVWSLEQLEDIQELTGLMVFER